MAKILLNVQLVTGDAAEQIKAIQSAFDGLAKSMTAMKPDQELTKQLNALARAYGSLTKAANAQLNADIERQKLEKSLAKLEADTEIAVKKKAKAISDAATAASKAVEASEKARLSTEKANLAREKAKAGVEQYAVAIEKRKQAEEKTNQEAAKTLMMEEKLFGQTEKNAEETEQYGEKVESLGVKFGSLVERYAKFYATSLLVRKPLELIKNALGDVGETLVKTEDAVIELQRVLDGTIPQSKEISDALYDLAFKYGQSFENASTVAANFARSGRDWNESLEATEAALLAMNVAELNATSASDGLLSIIQQFGMETSDLLTIVDKLNKTADKNPVTTGKLLEAIKRSGSAAKNANISFDETLALITSISEATNRSGQNIGTAINSLIQYSTKNVEVFRDLSDESSAIVDRFKIGAASIAEVWKQVAEDIHNSKERRDVLLEALGPDGVEELASTLHDELGDLVTEINGVYDVANTYRKNYFVALLDNMFDTEENGEQVLGRFSKVLADLQDVRDYSHKENDRYMETYTAKVNQLQAAWQKLANDEQGILAFKKTLAEIGISLVNFADASGGVVSTVSEIAGLLGGLALIGKADALTKSISTLGATIKATLTATTVSLQTVIGSIGLVTAAFSALVIAVNAVKAAQKEQYDESIQTAKSHESEAKNLRSLYDRYKELTPASSDYKEVESKILEILGDKAKLLDGVIGKTGNYKNAVEDLTKAQLAQYQIELNIAKRAAEKKLEITPTNYLQNKDRATFYGNAAAYAGKDPTQSDPTYQDILTYYDKLEARQHELAAKWAELKEVGRGDLSEYFEKEYETNQKLLDSVSADIKEYRDVIHTFNEIYDALNNPVPEGHIAGRAGVVPNLQEVIAAEKEEAEVLQATSDLYKANIEELKKKEAALQTVAKAQKEYNENGAVSASTMESLLALGDDWKKALFDEHHQLDLNSESVLKLVNAYADELEKYGILVPSIGEATKEREKIRVATEEEIAALQKNVSEKDKAIQAEQNQIALGKEFKDAIEKVTAAQKEQNETGKISAETREKLLGLRKSLVRAMVDENGELDVSTQRVQDLIAKWTDYVEELGFVIDKTEEVKKVTDETLEEMKSLISLQKSELSVLDADANASLEARVGKMAQIRDSIQSEIDHLRSVKGDSEEINRLEAERLGYVNKIAELYAKEDEAKKKRIEEQRKAAEQAAKEAEQARKDAEKAAEDKRKADLAAFDSQIAYYNSEIALIEAQNGLVADQVAWHEKILEALRGKIAYYEALGGYETEINALKLKELQTEKTISDLQEREVLDLQAAKLSSITDEISLLESRLTIAEKTYGAEEERISILSAINSLLADQIEYLVSIGAQEQEINRVKAEQLSIQAQILNLQQQTINAQANAEMAALGGQLDLLLNSIEVEEQSLDLTSRQVDLENDRADSLERSAQLEEEIAKAKLDYINSVIDAYMKGETSEASLEEKQAAVREARAKLAQARRDAVAKAMEDAYRAQQKTASDTLDLEEKRLAVEKARIALHSAENDLTTRVYNEETGEWERQADQKVVKDAQEKFDDAVRALNDFVEEQAWDEVIAAVSSGSVSESRMTEILERWATENYGEGSPEFISKIREAYRESLGSVDKSDTVVGAERAVQNAVKSLNDYLKQEAVRELKEYLEAGNRDAEGMREILDKWLGLGQGTELYSWRDGLLDVVTEAIESNYYDDSKVRSSISEVSSGIAKTMAAINTTNTSVKTFESTFVREIKAAAKVSSEAVAEVIAKYQGQVDARYTEWANQVYEKVKEIEDKEVYNNQKTENGLTQREIDSFVAEMQKNSKAWADADEEGRKQLSDRNLALGTMLGWKRDDASGIWYNKEGQRAYDDGGVLRGIGGIKATDRPEIVLDPDLTAKILRPNSDAQFRAFADALGLIFERGERIGSSSKPVINGQRYSDSHDTSTVINGVPIPAGVAENYTIAELARMMPLV